jgi:small GTP-binding protein
MVSEIPSHEFRSHLETFHITFLGLIAAGKSSIISRFVAGRFTHDIIPGPIRPETCDINTTQGTVRLDIKDTFSDGYGERLLPLYCRNADALVVVHDVSSPSSFEGCKRAYETVKNTVPEADVYFVGNKVDLPINEVEMEETRLWAESIGASYHITSAKTGEGVNALFDKIAERLVHKPKKNVIPISANVQHGNSCF